MNQLNIYLYNSDIKFVLMKGNDDEYTNLSVKYKKQRETIDSIKASDEKPKQNYDYFKIKNIIKSNLAEKNVNNKYDEFLREDVVDNYRLEEQSLPLQNASRPGIEEINKMELQVIEKTREIEQQIKEINRKRLEFVLGEFKAKLVELGKKDEGNFEENLSLEFKRTVEKLEEERNNRIISIVSLQEKVSETIVFCKKVNEDLKSKKIEINSDFDSYVDYLTKEKYNTVVKYGNDMEKYVEKRVQVFKSHLENQFK